MRQAEEINFLFKTEAKYKVFFSGSSEGPIAVE